MGNARVRIGFRQNFVWMNQNVFQYLHEYLGHSTRLTTGSRRQFRMVRLNVLLKSRNRIRFLILAGITAVILQTYGIDAQDGGRSEKSGTSDRPRKSANRERFGNEQRANLSGRFEKPFSQAGKRRGGANRDERVEPSPLFLEGDFESRPTDEGFVFVNGDD